MEGAVLLDLFVYKPFIKLFTWKFQSESSLHHFNVDKLPLSETETKKHPTPSQGGYKQAWVQEKSVFSFGVCKFGT